MGRKPLYKTIEEKKKAHNESTRKYAKAHPDIYRTASKSYYDKNKDTILAKRKEKRNQKQSQSETV